MMKNDLAAYIANRILQPQIARWLMIAIISITIFLSLFLPRLQFNFELEQLFSAESADYQFYQKHVTHFGFDNDYLTLLVIPDGASIYDWDFLSTMNQLIAEFDSLADVEFIYSPLDLRKVIKGPTGIVAFPLLQNADKLQNDSTFIANDPYLSQAFPEAPIFTLLVKHRHYMDQKKSQILFDEIKPIIGRLPYKYHIIGRIPAEKEFLGLIKTDFTKFLVLSLVICGLVLWRICRSVKLILYPFSVCIVTLIWTFGLMAAFNVPITIMTSLLPPMVLFVACSDTIHLISVYRSTQSQSQSIQKVLAATFLTSLTTAIGFISLIFVPIELIQDLGTIAAISVIFAFIATYAIAPFFLKGSPAQSNNSPNLSVIVDFTARYPRLIVLSFLILAGTGIWATSQLKVDAYLLHDMPSDAATAKSFAFADENLGGSKPWEMAIWVINTNRSIWDESVQKEIAKTVDYLELQYPIANLLSPSTFTKYARSIRHQRFDVDQISRQDQILARRIARQAQIQLVTKDNQMCRITGNMKEYGSLATNEKNQQLHAFMQHEIDLSIIGYRITGTNHLIDQSHHLLATEMATSLGIAIVLVSFVFGIYFRSWKWSLIALIPNIIPLIITGLMLYLLNVPIQLSTSIIFVLVFGIVVDDTIHFLATYKRSPASTVEEKLRYTMETSGRGMLNTTLTLVAGFCLFLFSDFGGTYYLGFFICIALIAALITDWLLLPVILRKLN